MPTLLIYLNISMMRCSLNIFIVTVVDDNSNKKSSLSKTHFFLSEVLEDAVTFLDAFDGDEPLTGYLLLDVGVFNFSDGPSTDRYFSAFDSHISPKALEVEFSLQMQRLSFQLLTFLVEVLALAAAPALSIDVGLYSIENLATDNPDESPRESNVPFSFV